MDTRTKSVLLVLLMLLLIGTSSQAATCEVRCGLGAALPDCHQAMGMALHSPQHVVGTSHCNGAIHRAQMALPQTGRCVANTCLMPSSSAVFEKSQTDGSLIVLHLLQGNVVAIGDLLEREGGFALNVPLRRSTPSGRLVGQLRV